MLYVQQYSLRSRSKPFANNIRRRVYVSIFELFQYPLGDECKAMKKSLI